MIDLSIRLMTQGLPGTILTTPQGESRPLLLQGTWLSGTEAGKPLIYRRLSSWHRYIGGARLVATPMANLGPLKGIYENVKSKNGWDG